MERFLNRLNIEHYRELLKGPLDQAQRETILKLLAEEEAKKEASGIDSPALRK